MRYYSVTCEDFANVIAECEIVKVVNGVIYVSSNENLKTPFKETNLPEDIANELAEALVRAKEDKKKEIDNAKINAIEDGIEFKGKVFQSAEYDRNLLTSTVSLFNIAGKVPDNFVWIAKDNTAVPMTLVELVALSQAMATDVTVNTIKARSLKDAVEKANTLAEVSAIKFE